MSLLLHYILSSQIEHNYAFQEQILQMLYLETAQSNHPGYFRYRSLRPNESRLAEIACVNAVLGEIA